MKQNMTRRALQRGFSLLTGFILAIIMFGTLAFFLAGQGINAGFGSSFANSAKVSSLLTSAGYIGTGFDAVVLAGNLPSAVTFNTANTTGVFNPTSGGASVQMVDQSLLVRNSTLDGYWIYRGNDVILPGVGTGVGAYTVMVSGLKSAICLQINNTLHTAGQVSIPTISQSDSVLLGGAVVVGSLGVASQVNGGAPVTLAPSAPAASGWADGCFATSSGNYVYIHTLLAQ